MAGDCRSPLVSALYPPSLAWAELEVNATLIDSHAIAVVLEDWGSARGVLLHTVLGPVHIVVLDPV